MTTIEGPMGTYRPCRTCTAPIVDPFPEAWEIELIKEGPQSGPVRSFITPHRDTCTAAYADPKPGIAVRIPGSNVAALRFEIPPPVPARIARDPEVPVARDPGGRVRPVPPGFNLDDGWTFLGYTDGGPITTAEAVGPIREGRAVTFAGPGCLFVKPVVPYDVDGGQPIVDVIADAAGVDLDEGM